MDVPDTEIARVLREADLPHDDSAVELLRGYVGIAQESAHDTAVLKLHKAEAIALEQAATVILNLARDYQLETPANLVALRRLRRDARIRLVATDKPLRRQWLGVCADNFQYCWQVLTQRPSGIYYADEPSPTLLFATACCRLVDETVNASAVEEAHEQFRKTETMSDEEYAAFWLSETGRLLRRSDL